MHIVLGILTTLVTILYLLDRMGFDLGGLNPFYWRRRRAWAKRYQGDPIYAVEDPLELAALFVAGVARLDGEVTLEQKNAILAEFSGRFSLGDREASQLLASSTHLLGQAQVVRTQLDGLLSRNSRTFSPDQIESLVEMMTTVAAANGDRTPEQAEFIESIRALGRTEKAAAGTWA